MGPAAPSPKAHSPPAGRGLVLTCPPKEKGPCRPRAGAFCFLVVVVISHHYLGLYPALGAVSSKNYCLRAALAFTFLATLARSAVALSHLSKSSCEE